MTRFQETFSGDCNNCGKVVRRTVKLHENSNPEGLHVYCANCGTSTWCDKREDKATL